MSDPIKSLHDTYYSNTPAFWRKVGDAVLVGGTTLTTTFAGMELDKGWVIAAALMTMFGKMVTNFFKDEGPVS